MRVPKGWRLVKRGKVRKGDKCPSLWSTRWTLCGWDGMDIAGHSDPVIRKVPK